MFFRLRYNDLVVIDVSKIFLRDQPMTADEMISFVDESCEVIRDVSIKVHKFYWKHMEFLT